MVGLRRPVEGRCRLDLLLGGERSQLSALQVVNSKDSELHTSMQSSCSSPYVSVGIRHHWPLICAIFSQG